MDSRSHPPPLDAQEACATRHPCGEEGGGEPGGGGGRWRGRAVALSASAAALSLCIATVAALGGAGGGGVGGGVVGLLGGGAGLADARALYRQDPQLLDSFGKALGKQEGKRLEAELQGRKARAVQRMQQLHQFKSLDKDMQLLSASVSNVTEHIQEAIDKPMLPTVNQNAAWMLVKGMSTHWDANANYTVTPWEFCSGRHLSRRQVRDCSEHLIRAAGIKHHRDLELDTRVWKLMCGNVGHTYIDDRGSTYALPKGTQKRCEMVITAKDNVDALLKRQVTEYKTHLGTDGNPVPPKREVQGSHGVPCGELDIGCRR